MTLAKNIICTFLEGPSMTHSAAGTVVLTGEPAALVGRMFLQQGIFDPLMKVASLEF
jgi:hypothetical protein